MAKETTKETAKETNEETKPEQPVQAQEQPPRVKIDDTGASCSYANFCRVTGTPEELIVDFGLNTQPFGEWPSPSPWTTYLE